jgi:hypothetical protein
LSHLTSNLEYKFDETSAEDMVKEFINTSISAVKELKLLFLPNFKALLSTVQSI